MVRSHAGAWMQLQRSCWWGKVGLHACPISFPLKASQRHPEEPMKTCSHRAETAWPLCWLAVPYCASVCASASTTRRGKSWHVQDHHSHFCLCKSPCRAEEKHTGLRAAAFCSKGQSLSPSIFLSPVPPVVRKTTKKGSSKHDHRQKDRI